MKSYVADTSAIIERIITKEIKEKKIKGTVIIPNAVIAELEAQANKRRETGFIGLDELKELQELRKEKKIQLKFLGLRPTVDQIKFAKAGEIDAIVRQIAYEESATLITADIVQAESAKAYGLHVQFIEKLKTKKKLALEKYFDPHTMSVHLKEGCHPQAKKGVPGKWKLVKIRKNRLSFEELREMSKEIIEQTRIDPHSFVEISRAGSTVVQYKNYRIVIVKTPVSDGIEITAIRPIKRLNLQAYKADPTLLERIKSKARGILIAGEVGSGKSTFAQAITEEYIKQGKVTKTVESPRDLQVNKEVTQYSKSFTTSEEIHDILFLTRPDNIIFDEIRDTPDFKLYTDLRLAGSNCLGVIHSSSAIDSIQRFIGRLETGMIPSVIDTVIFMGAGTIDETLTLKMTVKTPTGMTEADLARPVVEVMDFSTNQLLYEIYSYGEQTVIVPVAEEKSPVHELAKKQLEKEIKRYSQKAKIELHSSNRINLYVPEREIPAIIGMKGKRIEKIENELGMKITVKPLEEKKETIGYNVAETKKYIIFEVSKGLAKRSVEFKLEDQFLFSAIVSNKGIIQIHKKSQLGKTLLDTLNSNKKLEILH